MTSGITLLVAANALATLTAQSVVVPAANATVRGTSGLSTIQQSGARTYMLGINAAELSAIPVGASINGVSFRSYVGTSSPPSWPTVDVTWLNYDISVGPAIPTATMTGAFAANFASAPTMVRSGPMLMTTATPMLNNTALPAPAANPWSEFYFDFQLPYLYLGGDLAILFTHTTSNLAPNFCDIVASNAAAQGVAWSQTVYQGTAGVTASFSIPRIHYGYGAGCPGTGGRVPNLVQNANTTGGLGGPIYMSLANSLASTASVYVFGFGQVMTPMPNGCNLWTLPISTVLVLLDINGRGTFILNVPPAVVGGFNAQAVVLDAGGPAGYIASNAIEPRAF